MNDIHQWQCRRLQKGERYLRSAYTRNAPYVGVFGNGSNMKFIANHLVAIYNVAVGESLPLRTMGLDQRQVWTFATSCG